jgi:hypothetical protein
MPGVGIFHRDDEIGAYRVQIKADYSGHSGDQKRSRITYETDLRICFEKASEVRLRARG